MIHEGRCPPSSESTTVFPGTPRTRSCAVIPRRPVRIHDQRCSDHTYARICPPNQAGLRGTRADGKGRIICHVRILGYSPWSEGTHCKISTVTHCIGTLTDTIRSSAMHCLPANCLWKRRLGALFRLISTSRPPSLMARLARCFLDPTPPIARTRSN